VRLSLQERGAGGGDDDFRSARASAPKAAATPAPSSSGSAAPRTAASPVPRRPPAAPLDAGSKAALARARKLQAESNFDEAKAEFLKAWGGTGVMNLQPLVELGYMELQSGPRSQDEATALLRAGTASGDPIIEAQAWYNLSLAYARSGEHEAERAALARSLTRRDNQTVKAKLKGRSLCVVEVLQEPAVQQTVKVVSGWQGVCERVGRCDGTATTAAEARQQSCVTAAGAEQEDKHGCEGAGPWDSSWGYSWFTFQASWVAPLAHDRFFVAQGRGGGWPARCQATFWPTWSQAAPYTVAFIDESQLEPFPDRAVPLEDPENGACLESPGPDVTAVYAADTAKLLAAVRVPYDFGVTVRVDESAKRLTLSGGGCDGYVPLNGSMRFARNEP
jgi:hypothetical protein